LARNKSQRSGPLFARFASVSIFVEEAIRDANRPFSRSERACKGG
jgi:hypothetical protein